MNGTGWAWTLYLAGWAAVITAAGWLNARHEARRARLEFDAAWHGLLEDNGEFWDDDDEFWDAMEGGGRP